MLGVDRRAARAAWTVFLLSLAVLLVYVIRRTLLVFIAALLLAYLLSPLVDLVDRFARRRVSRNLSLAVVYILLLGLIGAAGGVVGSLVVREASELLAGLPALIKNVEQRLHEPLPSWLEPLRPTVESELREWLPGLAEKIVPFLRGAGAQILAVASNLIFLVLVPILSFFFLKDGDRLRQSVLNRLLAGPGRAVVEDIFADVHVLLGQFMRALVILCFLTFVFYGLFFAVAGVPYALLLATIAGLLEFIPMLGPLLAAAIILVVAGFSGYAHLLGVLAFLGAYRLFQDYVLQPHLMSSGLELHPILVIFGALAGEQIGGVWGVFLSVPVLATLRVVFVRLQKARLATEQVVAP